MWLGRPKLECSWVPADKVSNDVIEEFKRGYSTKTTLQTTAYNQQLTSTISIENCANGKEVKYSRSFYKPLYMCCFCRV